jgi:hypothetical protein
MRRPDIELTDEAATFVEQHPDVIARLAGDQPSTAEPAVVVDDARRTRFREYIRERRAAAATPEAAAGARAFLARYCG